MKTGNDLKKKFLHFFVFRVFGRKVKRLSCNSFGVITKSKNRRCCNRNVTANDKNMVCCNILRFFTESSWIKGYM